MKSIPVDRGSTVKQGALIAELEAPEIVAQRAQAAAAYQSAESQFAAAQAKLAADQSTYEHLSAAAKTQGVVAPSDLQIAEKTAQADEATVVALEKTADAAQANLKAVEQVVSQDHGTVRRADCDKVPTPGGIGRSGGGSRCRDADR